MIGTYQLFQVAVTITTYIMFNILITGMNRRNKIEFATIILTEISLPLG